MSREPWGVRLWAVFLVVNTTVVLVAFGAGKPPNPMTMGSLIVTVALVAPYLWRASR